MTTSKLTTNPIALRKPEVGTAFSPYGRAKLDSWF